MISTCLTITLSKEDVENLIALIHLYPDRFKNYNFADLVTYAVKSYLNSTCYDCDKCHEEIISDLHKDLT